MSDDTTVYFKIENYRDWNIWERQQSEANQLYSTCNWYQETNMCEKSN